ncbi:MAG: S8 family serine peptidase [Gammaproteobacteria bacterium]|nr:S8 family serine peptidase [Gammaproteobacteria bacterium]
MPNGDSKYLPHLVVPASPETRPYTNPASGGSRAFATPTRNRQAHAQALISQFEALRSTEKTRAQERLAHGLSVQNGLYLTFESEAGFELKFESLEAMRSGIELCNVKSAGDKQLATIFVPDGKLDILLNKVLAYSDPSRDSATGKPKNRELVESIQAVREAALRALWTDPDELFPKENNAVWWEVWLRVSRSVNQERFLRTHAERLGMQVHAESIRFLDRIVLLVRGTAEQMSQSAHLLAVFAEIRRPKVTAEFYLEMGPEEQAEWIDKLLARLRTPQASCPFVCLLDTGVTNGHPLLAPVADDNDLHTYNATWGVADSYGHGNPMAGTAIYGDLATLLESTEDYQLSHRIESVKVTPDPSYHQDPHLYGAITRDGIAQPEISHPERDRIYCMAITSSDNRDRGRPSSWSAAIDAISSGMEDERRRLIVLAAGNTAFTERRHYPHSNHTDPVHDPGQAWNAITVGAYTKKTEIEASEFPGWTVIAPSGDLAPSSCTSTAWTERQWPLKPDVVMEGGNMALDPETQHAFDIDSLKVVSTGHQPQSRLLVPFGDTSGASALIARLAAAVTAQYPNLWPETVRALIVHSARWTETMKRRFAPLNTRRQKTNLLRWYGYGVPDEGALHWSTRDSLTLIAESTLQPFHKDGGAVRTREIQLHALPWPVDELRALGNAMVEMRVTLSYFVEPNPGERGWTRKFRYQSHGLRFSVKRSLETQDEFRQRLNKQARDEEEDYQGAVAETGEWFLGQRLCTLGSLHCDVWSGTASELAERGHVAVYPVLGWWKERPALERWGNLARYALIVSISTPEVEADIYTPVMYEIAAQIAV